MASSIPLADRRLFWVNSLLLLAVALAGIAHLAFLPPFEGFDESDHFAYIQQIADTGTIPRFGIDKLSSDIESYPGPHSYSPRAPYDNVGGLTYRSFFNGSTLPSLTPENGLSYRPGHQPNREAQHPPLYYLMMTPFYLLAKSWSWTAVLLLLRSVSWAIAFAGFVIGCRATQQSLIALKVSPNLCLLAAAWPFLFPQFFPEMARLGNDSLCLLFMGVGWWLMLRILADRRIATTAALGVVLGLGMLTKAFFLPILVGCVALLWFHELREKDGRQLRNALVLLVSAGLIGGGWYLYLYFTSGSFIVVNDISALQRGHGSILSQIVSTVGLGGVLRGFGQLIVSFAWAGTWSYGRFSPLFTLPVILLAAVPLTCWLIKLRWAPTPVIAPLFIATPMVLGLCYYMLTQLARGAEGGGTSGWYLHIMAGPLSLALIMGWRPRLILSVLAVYALVYHAVLWTMQLSLFSGCAFKAGSYEYTQFDFANCFIVPERLSVLAEPWLGAVALAGALAAAIAAGLRWRSAAAV